MDKKRTDRGYFTLANLRDWLNYISHKKIIINSFKLNILVRNQALTHKDAIDLYFTLQNKNKKVEITRISVLSSHSEILDSLFSYVNKGGSE